MEAGDKRQRFMRLRFDVLLNVSVCPFSSVGFRCGFRRVSRSQNSEISLLICVFEPHFNGKEHSRGV